MKGASAVTVYEYAKNICPFGKRVVALGFFDGVHLGHRAILSAAKERASELGVPCSVFTFRSESEGAKQSAVRLYSTEAKLELIEGCGIDEVILADFDEVREISPEDFVTELLSRELGCISAIAGRDFRFGYRASGDTALLSALMSQCGGECIIADDVIMHACKISTTEIKKLMAEGNISIANEMLGTPYFLEAVVEHGRGVGRTLGFPTVNSPLTDRQGLLKHGVYLSEIVTRGGRYPALTNIGVCPTFEARTEHAETFVLDFNSDIYGERVRIILNSYLRPEIKFDTPEKLREQISKDIIKAKEEFENGR